MKPAAVAVVADPTPPLANASRTPAEIPACIARREPDAEYAWSSKRRLLVTKGDTTQSLSADDVRALFNFVEANQIEAQL